MAGSAPPRPLSYPAAIRRLKEDAPPFPAADNEVGWMTDEARRDDPWPEFRSPPAALPVGDDAAPARSLLAVFNDGECRAWIAAILAIRSRKRPPTTPSA